VPDKGWASHLRNKWRPERVRGALDRLSFLTRQSDENTQREFKVSYDLDKNTPSEEALPRIYDALGRCGVPHTVIFSHGVYVDVLPLRASKGKAVRYLSNKWNIPLESIATAGDSGNDADMLRGRTSGIAVGNYSAELEPLRHRVAGTQGLDAPKEGCDAGEQVLDTGAFGQIVVGAEPQARHRIELALASRKEDDGQLCRLRPQLAAQLEAALDLGSEADIDDHEIRKTVREAGERLLAAAVAGDAIAVAAQAGQVVVTNRALVLDDGYELGS